MKAKGRITVSRRQGGDSENPIVITIVDDISGVGFVEASMSLEVFAEVITGHGHLKCTLEYLPEAFAVIGKRYENKTETVAFPDEIIAGYGKDRIARVQTWLHKIGMEVDGWKANAEDINNHHRWGGLVETATGNQRQVSITFRRFVDQETGEPV